MMERVGDHLTYLSEYATGSIAFQNSEKMQKVRTINRFMIFSLLIQTPRIQRSSDRGRWFITSGLIFLQALVAAYCDLLDFYVKVRNLFTHKEGKLSCRLTKTKL